MSGLDVKLEIDLDRVEAATGHGSLPELPRTWLSDRIEGVLSAIGWVVNWSWLFLVVLIVGTVAMRHFLGGNTIPLEEAQWHIFAIGYLIGIGYAIMHDSHVRVDAVVSGLRPTTRAVIEVFGLSLFVLPMVWIVIVYAVPFVQIAFERGERSPSPGGLGNRWLIKAVIIVAFTFIGLAALARLLRVVAFLHAAWGGRPLPVGVKWVANLALLAGLAVVVALPFVQVARSFPPPPRDVARLIAQAYGVRSVTLGEMRCGFRPGFNPGPVSAEDARRAPLVFGWSCRIDGVVFAEADAAARPDARIFGLPLAEGARASGTVRLASRYNPVSGLRVPLQLLSDPQVAGH